MNIYKYIIAVVLTCSTIQMNGQNMTVDYRYAPDWHLSTPALPDDSFKTLVGSQGQLLYDYGGSNFMLTPLEKDLEQLFT